MINKILLGLAVTLVAFGVITGISLMSLNNDCVGQEAGVTAQYKQNQNNYDNYFKKLKEAAQVADMYTADLKNVYAGSMSGRYGQNGSKAVFQFIKEHNPNFDSKLYTQLQQIIEAGRNSFEADQKTLIDKKRVYEVTLKVFPGGIFAQLLGFPKIDLTKYDIITSEETDDAFKNKKAAPIKLR